MNITICQANFDFGYILRYYISAITVNARQTMTFTQTYIRNGNVSHSNDCYMDGYIKGYQVGLKWNDAIQINKRNITVMYDSNDLQTILTRILKKDRATISLVHCRKPENIDKFTEENSSNDFMLCISVGDDINEGLQYVTASRADDIKSVDNYANIPPPNIEPYCIMGKKFKNMMTVLGKPKKQGIKITYYNTPGDPAVLFTTNGIGVNQITQRSGTIPADDEIAENISQDPSEEIQNKMKVILTNTKFNEFIVDTDRINSLAKIAFHSEGSIMIKYCECYDLLISYEFGCYGKIDCYIPRQVIN